MSLNARSSSSCSDLTAARRYQCSKSARPPRAIQRNTPANETMLCGSVAVLDIRDIALLRLLRPRVARQDADAKAVKPLRPRIASERSKRTLGANAACWRL